METQPTDRWTDGDGTDRLDQSGPNYSQADIDDIGEPGENPDRGEGGSHPFGLLFKILFNPIEGWKAVRRSGLTPDAVQGGCFYPLLAVLALSKFAGFFYETGFTLQQALTGGVTVFVSFFLGYYCILMLLKLLIGGDDRAKTETPFAKVFVLLGLSSLALFFIVIDLLPMLWTVLIFLPLWTVYLVCRGARFFKFGHDRQITYTSILCLLTVGVPLCLEKALGYVMAM